MGNEITATNINFNSDGNQIIEEQKDGGGSTQVVKYGLIKLIGDRQERRVSFRTLLAITKAKDDGVESVMIRELNMAVKTSQIVMMRSEIEKLRLVDNISNLPTANLYLTLDFEISDKSRPYFDGTKTPHYLAVVHYVDRNGSAQYYLDFDKIKKLVRIDYDIDGQDYVSAIYHYGVKQEL